MSSASCRGMLAALCIAGSAIGAGAASAQGAAPHAGAPGKPTLAEPVANSKTSKDASRRASIDQYVRARKAYEAAAEAYWISVSQMRRARNAKRRAGQPVALDDYVLTQPPAYDGPPRPRGFAMPRDPERPRPPRIPTVAEFLDAAAKEYGFVPQRPADEIAFKRAYARVALAAGLTRDQAVRIYAFETGGNGAYDVQAGLTHRRPKARPISPAVGYNQLLSTNSVSLMAAHGDRFLAALSEKAAALSGDERKAMETKIEAVRRMVAFSRTVPNAWTEHDRLAKFTRRGMAIHAAIVDVDLGPLLQTQKLLDSVEFARMKGHAAPLTAAELEMMNFTGDGNGFDMVTMPEEFRPRVPTSNFFLRGGYERNPIARRTGVVSALFAAIEGKMDRASHLPGARELAEAFDSSKQASAEPDLQGAR